MKYTDYTLTLIFIFFALSILTFKLTNKLFKKIGIIDKPDQKLKNHKHPVTYNGGFVCFIMALISIIFFNKSFLNFENQDFYIFIFFVTSIFLIGFIDDIFKISANKRFVILILLITIFLSKFDPFILNDAKFSFYSEPIGFGPLPIVISTICILAFIQASNMIDGINCQFGSYMVILIIYLNLYSLNFTILLLPVLMVFLYFNFFNKSFFGDGGSYFLSFLIGILFIKLYNDDLLFSDDVFIAMSMPGYDMIRLFFTRLKKKTNPFKGDLNHIHHLFIRRFSEKSGMILSPLFLSMPIFLTFLTGNNILIIISTLLLYVSTIIFFKKTIRNF